MLKISCYSVAIAALLGTDNKVDAKATQNIASLQSKYYIQLIISFQFRSSNVGR